MNSTPRFGSSLDLNIHFHSLFLDGVYGTSGPFQAPVFFPAEPLASEEVHRVQRDGIQRIRRVLEAWGLNPTALGLPPRAGAQDPSEVNCAPEYEHPLLDFGEAAEASVLPELKAASIQSRVPLGPQRGQQLQRLLDLDLARAFAEASAAWSGQGRERVPAPLVATSGGFSLHAATVVPKGERGQLEKLCRYISRPAICLKRLEVQSDGRIAWYLRRAWRDGTKAFVMAPRVFLARLAALVPHPREHQLTYHGVLAPASPLRDLVVPRQVVQEEGGCSARPGHEPQRGAWIPWAELLKRVFGEDVLACPHCHGRRHMISAIRDPDGSGSDP